LTPRDRIIATVGDGKRPGVLLRIDGTSAWVQLDRATQGRCVPLRDVEVVACNAQCYGRMCLIRRGAT